jgi:poly(A) polymerase
MWDPSVSDADRKSLMPVLTPMVPFMNSTFNVVGLTHKILMDEFKRAAELTRKIWNPETVCQSALPELQAHYPTRLSIKLFSSSKEEKWLFMWEALIVSKLRVLLYHLERIPGLYCRPFPVAVPVDEGLVFSIFLAILPINGQEKRLIDFNDAVAQFHGAVVTAMESRDDQIDLRKNCRLTVSLDKE